MAAILSGIMPMNNYVKRIVSFCKMKIYKQIQKNQNSSLKARLIKMRISPDTCRKALFFSCDMSGSMTVEAALLLPMLLFLLANLLSLFLVYGQYSKALSKAHQTVKNQTQYVTSLNVSNPIAKSSKWITYNPLFEMMGFDTKYGYAQAMMHKWTGYDLSGGAKENVYEEYVYMTENGSVYHRSRGCSHLNIHIRVVNLKDINLERNENGAFYYPCEKCARGMGTGLVFISKFGNRYHNSADCSGLKRSIRSVKLSEVSCGACSECGY